MEVLRDAEGESVKYKPGGRLDMSHGFLKHIRRNQIARDDYDREVKQAKEKQKHRHANTPRRPRRPDRQVYHPRHQNGSEPGVNAEDWNESSSGTEQENTGTELFWLDYQADNGQITSFIVHKPFVAPMPTFLRPVAGGQARSYCATRGRKERSGLSHEGGAVGTCGTRNGQTLWR
ncbi:UPF0561 protein C2orf68 homolog isoform X1 [Onychostoma macrolepis]|uniref:UPF0561 protein C2orf68 homolog isoform X1 n=1 Tax=Onychostoma macrolepis TaxID=369639 RepID=UPI00272B2836|nr:UPF0561 protein C2orf68 homolog isoform X1 [Onychostoma macrolepis]